MWPWTLPWSYFSSCCRCVPKNNMYKDIQTTQKIHTLLPAFSCEHLQKWLLLLWKYTPSNPERNFIFTSCIPSKHCINYSNRKTANHYDKVHPLSWWLVKDYCLITMLFSANSVSVLFHLQGLPHQQDCHSLIKLLSAGFAFELWTK